MTSDERTKRPKTKTPHQTKRARHRATHRSTGHTLPRRPLPRRPHHAPTAFALRPCVSHRTSERATPTVTDWALAVSRSPSLLSPTQTRTPSPSFPSQILHLARSLASLSHPFPSLHGPRHQSSPPLHSSAPRLPYFFSLPPRAARRQGRGCSLRNARHGRRREPRTVSFFLSLLPERLIVPFSSNARAALLAASCGLALASAAVCSWVSCPRCATRAGAAAAGGCARQRSGTGTGSGTGGGGEGGRRGPGAAPASGGEAAGAAGSGAAAGHHAGAAAAHVGGLRRRRAAAAGGGVPACHAASAAGRGKRPRRIA